jgi:hypothetical protein
VSRRLLVEEGDSEWDEGMMASYSVMAAEHRNGPMSVERRRYAGMVRLLRRVFDGAKGCAGKKRHIEAVTGRIPCVCR